MCCRINSSGPAARTIVGLYILLATFLVGFFAVAVISGLNAGPDSGSVTFEEATEILKASEDVQGCQNADGIYITKRNDFLSRSHYPDPVISIANLSAIPITYLPADIDGYAGWDSEFVVGHLPIVPTDKPTKVLNPQQVTEFSTGPYGHGSGLKITFRYRFGHVRSWRYMVAHFPEGSPSPSNCITRSWRP